MSVRQIVIILILAFAIYLAWTFSRGRSGRVPLYLLPWLVAISLLAGAVAQLLGATGVVEALNVMAIAVSIAALASSPRLWREQVQRDLQGAKLERAFESADLLSWRAWLKLAKRLGAAPAACWYFGALAAAALVAVLAALTVPDTSRTFA